MLVRVLRSTVYPGARLSQGEEVEVPKDEAKALISMGKVEAIEARTDVIIGVEDDSLKGLKVDELKNYADELGIELEDGLKKAQIIEAIEAALSDAEHGDIE